MAPTRRKCSFACECVTLHPAKTLHEIQSKPQEWKPDPEMGLKHDDLYARAWECENETSIFDIKNDIITKPSSPGISVQSDSPVEET